jgi:hypothetical protein
LQSNTNPQKERAKQRRKERERKMHRYLFKKIKIPDIQRKESQTKEKRKGKKNA